MDRVQVAELLREDSLILTIKSKGIHGTDLINLGRLKGWVKRGAT